MVGTFFDWNGAMDLGLQGSMELVLGALGDYERGISISM